MKRRALNIRRTWINFRVVNPAGRGSSSGLAFRILVRSAPGMNRSAGDDWTMRPATCRTFSTPRWSDRLLLLRAPAGFAAPGRGSLGLVDRAARTSQPQGRSIHPRRLVSCTRSGPCPSRSHRSGCNPRALSGRVKRFRRSRPTWRSAAFRRAFVQIRFIF